MRVQRRAKNQLLVQTLLAGVCGLLFNIPVWGLDRDRSIAQFYHTAWTAKGGAPSQITALAQTEDGYLWIGSVRGLFRFDGVQFEPYVPPAGMNLPSHNIYSLMATPDGGLWISFNPSGLAFLKDGVLSIFSRPEELPRTEVICFARDFDGRIWGGTRTGLVLLEGSRWVEIGTAWNFNNQGIWYLFVDRDGTLWVSADDTILFLRRGSKVFQPTGIRGRGFPKIAQASDGRLWITEYYRTVRRLPLAGRDFAGEPEINIQAGRLLFDREGSLWLTGGMDGVRRLRFPERLGNRKVEAADPELEPFNVQDGLSDNTANHLFEDREGNIWISSENGLDRFRHSHLVPVILPPGHSDLTLLAGDKGEVWVGSAASKPVLRVSGENILPVSIPMQIACVYRDANKVIWWSGHGGIWRQRNEQFEFFPQPKGLSLDSFDWLWEVIPNNLEGGLSVRIGDVGLISFRDGIWDQGRKPPGRLEDLPSASYQDPAGRIWLGYRGNRVSLQDGERVQNYTQDDGINIGRIRAIRGRGPRFWFGGELGLAIFDDGFFRTVRTTGPPFGTVSGIVETPDGALWLNELHGVVRISPEEVRQVSENMNHLVSYQVFDLSDGLPGGPQLDFRCSTAIEATDGRLWFSTINGLAWIDPTHIAINTVPPPVTIRSLETAAKKYEPQAALHLPPGTASLRIDYTALSLSIPERVRFRYRLEGWDQEWQDAGTQRKALYTNLGPGKYVFRVIACNNDGVWNNEGAILEFIVAPAWYQTNTFMVLCIVAGLFGLWTIYRLRVRQIARALSARFDERLAERTRIARELHDTFLQTIQGSKMVADDALDQPTDAIRMRKAMERLSGWLGQATDEGRTALNSLRTSTTQGNDLTEGLRRATMDGLTPASMDINFSVVGNAREMHPIVRDEVYRIGYEAIRNASKHSGASRLEVELKYGQDLLMRVRDNGIGIDPAVANEGKEGHFGLPGMRERAARIGGNLTLVSSPGSGTEIRVAVPGRFVFRKTSPTIFNRIRDLYRRKRQTSDSH